MPACAIKWCKNHSSIHKKNSGITFHRFPTDILLKKKWAEAVRIGRNQAYWNPSKTSVVCSLHFKESDLKYTELGFRRVKKNATPMIGLVNDPKTCKKMEKSCNDHKQLITDLNIDYKTEMAESGHDDEQFTSGLNTDQSNNEKEIDMSNLYGDPLAEHMEVEPEIRGSDLESLLISQEEYKLRLEVRRYKTRIKIYKQKLKSLNQKVRRLTKQNVTLSINLKKLEEKHRIDDKTKPPCP